MTQVKILITVDPCCERVRYLSDILNQARNINLNDTYQLALETLILDMMSLVSQQNTQGVIDLYDSNLDNIVSLRDTAFEEWKNEVKNRFVPVPKTPPPPPPPQE